MGRISAKVCFWFMSSGWTLIVNRFTPRTWNPEMVPLASAQMTKSPLSEAARHSMSYEASRKLPSLHRFSSWNSTSPLSIEMINRRFWRIPVTRGCFSTFSSLEIRNNPLVQKALVSVSSSIDTSSKLDHISATTISTHRSNKREIKSKSSTKFYKIIR
uniref:(northern house mosquito) hypothetical protein n=1 Tax=Culex pipiens TaxID=7175 RepID=A0A8D8F2P5_CULPI